MHSIAAKRSDTELRIGHNGDWSGDVTLEIVQRGELQRAARVIGYDLLHGRVPVIRQVGNAHNLMPEEWCWAIAVAVTSHARTHAIAALIKAWDL